MSERIGVLVNYVVRVPGGNESSGCIEFVARVPGAAKPDGLVDRAQRAVARRLRVPIKSVSITGLITY